MKKTLVKKYGNSRLTVELDRNEVYPDDPGQGTPAMVYLDCPKGRYSATYWRAIWEGCVTKQHGRDEGEEKRLSIGQLEWLGRMESEITDFLYKQEKKDA